MAPEMEVRLAPIQSATIPRSSDANASPNLARALIEDALAPVTEDLERLSRQLPAYIPTEAEAGRRVVDYIFSAGGKRVRPALYYLCCKVVGYAGPHLDAIAAVGEFVHTASLLHDDVVDDSSLRRGKPTASSIWGDETSVLVGDLVYSTASEMMAATGNMDIVRTFARAIRLMSDGELMQLENLYNGAVTEATYLRILECKTAILIETVCRSAALLAGSSQEVTEALANFGHSVGMAFQLIDDALDYTSAAEILGKECLADLPDGKVTLPLILAREAASEDERRVLLAAVQMETITRREVNVAKDLVETYGTAAITVDRARAYTERAMDELGKLPAGSARDDLENLARKLLFRFN